MINWIPTGDLLAESKKKKRVVITNCDTPGQGQYEIIVYDENDEKIFQDVVYEFSVELL